MRILSILLPALALAVVILMLIELRQWRAGRRLISGRQAALRIGGGLTLLAILTAIFIGLYQLGLGSPRGHPVLFLLWWSACLLGSISLIILALADMRHVEERQRERENQLWREFARMLADRIRRERGQDRQDAGNEHT